MPASVAEMSIESLERLISKRRRDLAKLMKKRQKIERKLEAVDQQIVSLGGTGAARGSRAKIDVSLAEAITGVLKKAGGALSVDEITEKVLATGYRSNSPKFRSIVNQNLGEGEAVQALGEGDINYRFV